MALPEIVEQKHREVAQLRQVGEEALRKGLEPSRRSLEAALRRAKGPAFILECKAASPSRGRLAPGSYDPVGQALAYAAVADAISVLADATYFGGSPDHVRAVSENVEVPVLFKDIVVDPLQVVLARRSRADAVLLMAAVLDDTQLVECATLAAELGMDVLAEAHDEDELRRVVALGFPIIGINNRNLKTLTVDLQTVQRLSKFVPADRVLIAESGISSRADVVATAPCCDGFLIGGVLNSASRPDLVARELVFGRTKVCGLTRAEDVRAAYEAGATDGGVILSRHTHSPRRVDATAAADIVADVPLRMTGVFVNDSIEDVVRAVSTLNLAAVQLHGDEDAAYLTVLRGRLPDSVEIVDVERMREERPNLARLEACDRLLLDTFVPGVEGGTGQSFDLRRLRTIPADVMSTRIALAGGIGADNITQVARLAPAMVELNSRVEVSPGVKASDKVEAALQAARQIPTRRERSMTAVSDGRFGAFGGAFVPQILVPALRELTAAFEDAKRDPEFEAELRQLLRDFAGRPTPLYQTTRLCADLPATILLKREDLVHGGAHKTNQVLAQALLARRLGKTRLIAETGAGQHGVATAMVAALFGFECVVYMGAKDVARQQPNVQRMRLMGAEVRAVDAGEATLKEAINEAMRDWASSYDATHYVLGTVAGPHPYPTMVRDFQRVIGDEARRQCFDLLGRLPDVAVAAVGGGSNAIGLFTAFLDDDVELVGVEPHGHGIETPKHGATLGKGKPGVLHGSRTYVLQDDHGQIRESHSISAGLDYPAVGPEHAALKDAGRVTYDGVTDEEALEAFMALTRTEGIIPALESSHALAYAMRRAKEGRDEVILVNLSGRGDKDLATVMAALGGEV